MTHQSKIPGQKPLTGASPDGALETPNLFRLPPTTAEAGPQMTREVKSELPLGLPLQEDSGFLKLWDAIIHFHEPQSQTDEFQHPTPTSPSAAHGVAAPHKALPLESLVNPIPSSLDSLKQGPQGFWRPPTPSKTSGLVIKRDPEDAPNIRPFVQRKKSADDGS